MSQFTHFDDDGKARMVDVSQKAVSTREAIARGRVRMQRETLERILNRTLEKGDVFQVARLAGIMAAKRTGELIPLCHPLPLASVTVDFRPLEAEACQAFQGTSRPCSTQACVEIEATVRTVDRTGVEMEALTAVSVAALTLYDMCKAVDKGMLIEEIGLLRKSGGKSGLWVRPDDPCRSAGSSEQP
ncbi:MAG: cyclic pyranopterin monophosphate synthase MoaC [Myxococcota bacterium]